MPALNIIAIQETVLNSGSSSSLPSGMLPKRPSASQITKTTKTEASTTNSQPMFLTRPVQGRAGRAEPRLLVSTKPQATKARAMAAVTPKTTRSIFEPRALSSTTTGVSRAGWTVSLSGGGCAATVDFLVRVSMLTQVYAAGGRRPSVRQDRGQDDSFEANRPRPRAFNPRGRLAA